MFRPVKIRQYLALMKSRGHTAEAVLDGCGIDLDTLSHPDFLMDVAQAKKVVSNMIMLSGDQGIGLEAGNKTELADLGLVGHAMMSARCAREAVHYWINYSNSLVGMMVKIRLEENAPDDWSMVITESEPLGFIYNFCVEEMLVMIYKQGGYVTGIDPVMTQLELSYPSPSHQERYAQYFKGPIKFNADQTRISFSRPQLDQPLRGNDEEFNDICVRQCQLLMRRIGSQNPYVSKIRHVLMRLGGRTPSQETVARELNISTRTLRQHLNDEGLNFQQVLNEFRIEMAKEYLRSESMTPKEVAYLLGFQDTNSFRRAFKGWMGKTILEYRSESMKN